MYNNRKPIQITISLHRDLNSGFKSMLYSSMTDNSYISTNITSILGVVLPFFSLWFLPLSLLFYYFGWGEISIKFTKKITQKDWGLEYVTKRLGWFPGFTIIVNGISAITYLKYYAKKFIKKIWKINITNLK